MPVPSPTYLLQNVYEYEEGPSVYHYDLYRLQSEVDLQRLDLRVSLRTGVSLIEWPERLGAMIPNGRLDLDIRLADPDVEEAAVKLGLVPPKEEEPGSGEEEEEKEEGDYEDHRWRCITLSPHGRHWAGVVQKVADRAAAEKILGAVLGQGLCYVPGELEKALGLSGKHDTA